MNPLRTSLLKAVHTALDADPGIIAAFPGKLWTGEIPESQATQFPACVVDQAGGTWEFSSGSMDLEKTHLGVSAFALTAAELEACLDRLQAFLPDTPLQLTNDDEICYFIPSERTIRPELIRSTAGQMVFAGDLVYECAIWRH